MQNLDVKKENSLIFLIFLLFQPVIIWTICLGYQFEVLGLLLCLIILVSLVTNIKNGIVFFPLFLYEPITGPAGFQFSEIFVLLFFVVTLMTTLIEKQKRIVRFPLLIVFLLIIVSYILSLIKATYIVPGLKYLVRTIEAIFVFYIVYNYIYKLKYIKNILIGVVVAGVIASLHGIYQFYTGTGNIMGFERRIFGLQGGGYGAFIGTSIICALSLILYSTYAPFIKSLLVLCVPILGVALILHQTRAWYLSTFLAILFLLLKFKRKRKSYIFILLSIFVTFILLLLKTNLFGILPENLFQYAQKTAFQVGLPAEQSKGKLLSVLSRLYLWWKGFQLFKTSPIFGFGLGNLRFKNMLTGELGDPTNPRCGFIDNQYLNILYETGIIGGICWFILIFRTFSTAKKLLAITREPDWQSIAFALIGSLIVFFVGGFFWCITVTHEMIVFLFFLLGLTFLSLQLQQEFNIVNVKK